MGNNKRRKKKKGKNLIVRYFAIVFGCVGIYILLYSAITFRFMVKSAYTPNDYVDENTGKVVKNKTLNENSVLGNMILPPSKTSFLLVGLDESDLLTDVVILGVFDRDTDTINLLSIPRDTYVEPSKEIRDYVKEHGRKMPQSAKMTEVYSWAGDEIGINVTKKQIENMFNISIDYYGIIYIDAFKKIVDTVGPITMEIPKGGLHYKDPVQGLYINVPEGIQKLDGRLAEGVVRFRKGYARGDLARIEMQQRFMMELFKQTLNNKNLTSNIQDLLTTFVKYVKTDFPIEEMSKYLPYITKLTPDSLVMQTLPGTPKTMVDVTTGVPLSYVVYDPVESQKIIDRMFYDDDKIEKLEESKNSKSEDSRELKIKIINGGNKAITSRKLQQKLKTDGYEFVDLSKEKNTESKMANTRIIVKDNNVGADLQEYFNGAVIIKDKDYLQDYDIVIITGTIDE